MENYTIEWCEKKETKTGKAVLNCTLKNEAGVSIDKVSIWSDFPNFANIMSGHKVTGTLYTNDKGYKTLYPPKTGTTASTGNSAPNKGGYGVKAAQERKAEMIEKAQERKSESIAYFNAVNSAIALLPHLVKNSAYEHLLTSDLAIQECIKVWRDWFLSEWEKYNDPTSKQPF